MGIIIRQSIQNTLISYIGVAFGVITTLFLYPNILETEEYGLTQLFVSLTFVSSQFSHLGIKNVIIRYFPFFEESKESRMSFLTMSLAVPLAGYLLFAILFLLFQDLMIQYYRDQSQLFSTFYLYLLPMVFGVLFFEILNSYVRALRDSITGSLIHEILVRIVIIGILVLHHFGQITFAQFMLLFVSTFILEPVVLLLYLYIRGELSISFSFFKHIAPYAKNMARYGVFALLGGLSTILVRNIDIIMLGSMTSLANTAVYALAFYAGSVIAIPQRSIGKIADPILAKLLKEEAFGQVETVYKKTSLNQMIAGGLLFAGIWGNMHNFLYLLPPEYSGVKWVVIIIGAAKLFDMATGANGMIILNSVHYRFDLYTNIFLVILTISTNYLLIPMYGIIGAAIATAFSIFCYNFIKVIFVWKKFKMQPFDWKSMAVCVIAAGSLLLSFQVPYLYNFFVDVILRSAMITLVFMGLILLFNISSDINNLIAEGWHRIRNLLP